MSIHRIAVIFDDRSRPDTTGVYVGRALAELVEVVHFQPDEAESIPCTRFDLYLSIDDASEHRLPPALRPRGYWAIDTHMDFDARLHRSSECDLVFAAQRDGAERLRAEGIESATWLPLACDPVIHCRHEMAKAYDVAFIGHIYAGVRQDALKLVAERFPEHFIGQAFFDEMARIYSASRVVFNRSLCNDVNMRVFEGLCSGSLLVTNDLSDNGQADLFQDRVHLATYRDPDEMLEIIAYYLAHPDEREAIAAAGRAEAVSRHTYRHRMERLLAEADRRLGRAVGAVQSA
jgi:O-antigen biosynthesis protein